MTVAAAQFDVIENMEIPLADGTRLAARVWMPRGAASKPQPAILEYLPYRKRDGTSVRDDATYPQLAAAGYVGVRVDIRGTGDSDGLFDDEYSARELSEAVEVIDWLAAQPWCDGNVGMMGISWGGFNALQVAALRPKPLKAVISIASTVDRYNDDIHYKGGALLTANISWAGYMLAYISRPPDPALVGERWREIWLDRLQQQPLPLATWLRHQTRDEFWRHGSICENYQGIEAATLIIAGWGDGYKNAPPAAAANLTAPVKAINGPWIHKYPHFAMPHPRADFLAEAIRWWDRWLRGKKNGAERLPAYRAFITEAIRPSKWRERDPGRWVAEKSWPSKSMKTLVLYLTANNGLDRRMPKAATASISSPQDVGVMGGEFFTLRPDGELPGDQRRDDAGSLVFETAPLAAPLELLGRVRLRLRVAIDAPQGILVARLNDVHADGVSQRVSYGVLNLAQRASQTAPSPMQPGKAETIAIQLDECGHHFRAGHRLRIAISTAYWPIVQPGPHRFTATIELGEEALVELPVRKSGDHFEVPEPNDPQPLPKYPQLTPGECSRSVTCDLNSGLTRYSLTDDSGEYEITAADGLVVRERRHEVWSIAANDPLSSQGEIRWLILRRRGKWEIKTESYIRFRVSATEFIVDAGVKAMEGNQLAHEKVFSERIERKLI